MGLTDRGTGRMNYVAASGRVLGDSELRTLDSGRELLNFDLWVDGREGADPLVHVGYFPKDTGDVRHIANGKRVVVYGSLRHRCDRLFVAARELVIVTEESGDPIARRCGK